MLRFFIELYENIIDTFNYLVSDDEEYTRHSSHYIITINDPSNNPPIATYDQLFLETQPYSLKQLVAEEHIPALATTPTSHSQSSNKSLQNLEEIHLEESMILTQRIIDDYYVVQDHNTQNSIDHDDGWEFINCRT
jgi:hypothetical protein